MDQSPTPHSADPKCDLDSPATTLDQSNTPPPSDPKSVLDSPGTATLDQSPTPSPSDPKSDPASVPDAAAAADQPASSAASVADDVGDSSRGEVIEGAEVEEEEEGECGFCIFMKSGGCKESFVAWEDCVERAEKSGENIVDKCFEITGILKKCMEEHADYYEPILRAEEAMLNAVDTALESEVQRVADTTAESDHPGTKDQNEGKGS